MSSLITPLYMMADGITEIYDYFAPMQRAVGIIGSSLRTRPTEDRLE